MKKDYYDIRAQEFYDNSVGANVSELYKPFLELLPIGGRILDAGCGSGRDTKAFLENGYKVDAMDASAEMVRMATSYAGVTVKHKRFEEVTERDVYDGIWACASLLHIPRTDLARVLSILSSALKGSGYLYASFKYGTEDREEGGRLFTDLDEMAVDSLLGSTAGLKLFLSWRTDDVRRDRKQSWINFIARKGAGSS
jgi:SAM-dependent methyltransferase